MKDIVDLLLPLELELELLEARLSEEASDPITVALLNEDIDHVKDTISDLHVRLELGQDINVT